MTADESIEQLNNEQVIKRSADNEGDCRRLGKSNLQLCKELKIIGKYWKRIGKELEKN